MTESDSTPDPIDWRLTTFDGVRREQLRLWSKLSLEQILLAQEEMEAISRQLHGENYEKVLRRSYMSPEEIRALRDK